MITSTEKPHCGDEASNNAPTERLPGEATRVFRPDVHEKQELSKRNTRDRSQDVSSYRAKRIPKLHCTTSALDLPRDFIGLDLLDLRVPLLGSFELSTKDGPRKFAPRRRVTLKN
jgi:hypothetical protein